MTLLSWRHFLKQQFIVFKEESTVDQKILKRLIEANPPISMTTLARKRNVSLFTESRAVNRDLGMTRYV